LIKIQVPPLTTDMLKETTPAMQLTSNLRTMSKSINQKEVATPPVIQATSIWELDQLVTTTTTWDQLTMPTETPKWTNKTMKPLDLELMLAATIRLTMPLTPTTLDLKLDQMDTSMPPTVIIQFVEIVENTQA